MQRLKIERTDRGAVAVWVGILLVPIMVVAALAIDVGSMQADRQRLQTGADAAALAIAQHCAEGNPCDDEHAEDIAEALVAANDPLGGTASVDDVDLEDTHVIVTTTSTSTYVFAPAADFDESELYARGAASWAGQLPGGTLPLAFNFCTIKALTGATEIVDADGNLGLDITSPTSKVILYSKGNQGYETAAATCQSGKGWSAAPGNFGWLDVNSTCFGGLQWVSTGVVEGVAEGDTGFSPVQECKSANAQFAALIAANEELLLPVYSTVAGNGSNAKFTIIGYAVIHLKGIQFPSLGSAGVGCTQNGCVNAEIIDWVSAEANGSPIGNPVVRLMLPERLEG
ncbi:Tad domain-containing protein [Agrococcus beijingensis]|uniref:Tad domain-containing protein n=1 Tax=Agrococcus beijingensis TaxID=3068634 RepID=UPI002740A3C0|nr:Tad domain-containing protein [Agrococcus sp. REN33]